MEADFITQSQAAFWHALHLALPEIPAQPHEAYSRSITLPARRPSRRDVEVRVFAQQWSSTALGFGGMGGAAMTTAYTTVVTALYADVAAVYFGSTFAYLVNPRNPAFVRDLGMDFLQPVAVSALYRDPA